MKTKSSVPIPSRSTIQLSCEEKSFSQNSPLEKLFFCVQTGNWLWLRTQRGDLMGKLGKVCGIWRWESFQREKGTKWELDISSHAQWFSRNSKDERGKERENDFTCLSCYVSSQRCQERAADSTTFIIFYLRFSIKHFLFYFPIIFQNKISCSLSASAPVSDISNVAFSSYMIVVFIHQEKDILRWRTFSHILWSVPRCNHLTHKTYPILSQPNHDKCVVLLSPATLSSKTAWRKLCSDLKFRKVFRSFPFNLWETTLRDEKL